MTKKSPVVLAGFACFSLSSSFAFFFITHHFVNPRNVCSFCYPVVFLLSSFRKRKRVRNVRKKHISREILTKPHYRACRQHSCDCIINHYATTASDSQGDQRYPDTIAILFSRIATLVVQSIVNSIEKKSEGDEQGARVSVTVRLLAAYKAYPALETRRKACIRAGSFVEMQL